MRLHMRWFRTALVIAIAGAGCDRYSGDATERPTTVQARAAAAPPGHTRRARGVPRARDPRGEPAPAARGVNEPSWPERPHEPLSPPRPATSLARVAPGALCVTRGELDGSHVAVPTFRAVAPDSSGDRAAMTFVVRGETATTRALASGQDRRQLGLKLRAQDGCNLVYVMWRLDPVPKLDVSVKQNPGARTAKECGADGYTKVRPLRSYKHVPIGTLDDGVEHELRAAIDADNMLSAWIDDHLVWRGRLPAAARALEGTAGLRSDNLDFELVSFRAEDGAKRDLLAHDRATPARCQAHADAGD